MTETVTEYLRRRKYNNRLHPVIICEEEQLCHFPLFTLAGVWAGYQQHRPFVTMDKVMKNNPKSDRYYVHRKSPTVTCWGVESLALGKGPVFALEGVFDACRITSRRHSAVATLCNDPQRDYSNWLQCLGRPIVAVCDNDKAGRKLAKFGNHVEVVPGGDLGDAPEEYVTYLLRKYGLE